MPFREDQIKALKAKLDPTHVAQRAQAGRQLSYIEGWHAIAEANRIFGFDAWDRELVRIVQLGEPREVDGKWRVAYMATVRIRVYAGETEIVRDGTGYGSGIDRDIGQAHESALKEAETDAMKRSLMTFGNPFGLALYDKTQANVGVDETDAIEAIKKEARGRWSVATSEDDVKAVYRGLQADINRLSPEGKAEMVKFFSAKAAEFKKDAA